MNWRLAVALTGTALVPSVHPNAQGTVPLQATRLHVDAAAAPGGDGLTWATARNDLRQAIVDANRLGVGVLWVAAGTYTPAPPNGDRGASFRVTADLEIYGGFRGGETALEQRDPAANLTLLSGDLNGDDGSRYSNRADNSLHVVELVGSSLRLDGLVVRAGYADGGALGAGINCFKGQLTLSGMRLVSNLCEGGFPRGGGLFARRTVLRLEDTTVQSNVSRPDFLSRGGGLYLVDCTTTIEGGRFYRNLVDGAGGGIYVEGGSIALRGATFEGHDALNGGAILSDTAKRFEASGCRFLSNGATTGASLFLAMAPLFPATVEDCLFRDNLATQGAGISPIYQGTPLATLIVRRCAFEENEATDGCGIFMPHPNVLTVVEECSFTDNLSTSGAGISVSEGSAHVSDSTFTGNRIVSGGGVALFANGSAVVERCTFANNSLHPNAGVGRGGHGLYNAGSRLEVIDSLVHHNEVDEVRALFGTTILRNCTIVHDDPASPALFGAGELHGSIVWGANPDIVGPWSAEHCAVGGGFPGTGNLDDDPLFLDEAGGDFRLAAGSPCIDAADPGATSSGLDLAGSPRWIDGDLDGQLVEDIGAFEHTGVGLSALRLPDGVRITTSGTPATQAVLLAGPGSDPMLLPGAGYLFLQSVLVEPWSPAPGTSVLPVPPALVGTSLTFQVVAAYGPARNVSNPVTLAL